MATSLGSLVVSLGLNAVEFTTGLTKSERDAARFAKKLDEAIATGAKAAAGAIVAMGAAAAGAFAAVNELANQAGNFKDLEEITGANAEALASFAVAAGTAGVSMETVAGAVNKLTKGLVTTEDETKDAGAALAALGIPIKEFKALDPATQIETVAKALAEFEDGAGKTAVAMALFGKSGAALLPFFKELASEGGRQVILTQQQIERADAYADAQARVRTQLNLYLQALATEALPTITSITTATKEFVAQLLGVSTQAKNLDGEQIRRFAEAGALALGKLVDAGDGVSRVFQGLGLAIAAGLAATGEAMKGNLAGARLIIAEFQKDLGALVNRPLFTSTLQDQFNKDRALREAAAREDRGFKPPRKQLNFSGKDAAAKKAEITDAEKLIASLEKQLEKTQDLTVLEQVELEISKAKFSGLTAERQAAIEALAVRIQDAEIAKKAGEDARKAEEEASRIREQNSKAMTKQIETEMREAEVLRSQNETIKENIAFITGGEEAVRKLTDARLDSLIALKLEEEAALKTAGANDKLIAAVHEQVLALQERKALLAKQDIAVKVATEAKQLAELEGQAYDIAATAIDRMTQRGAKASDVLRALIDDIARFLTQQALVGLKANLLGGQNQGGDIFSMLAKLAVGYFSGGTSYVGGVDPVPPMFGSFAAGSAYIPHDQLAVVHRGERITPAADNKSGNWGGRMVPNVTQNIQVQGQVSRASQYQMAARAQEGLARVARRR